MRDGRLLFRSLLRLPLSLFQGRTGNAAYVLSYLALMAGGSLYRHTATAMGRDLQETTVGNLVVFSGSLLIVLAAGLLTRRMHDIGLRGRWGLLCIGLLVLIGMGKLAYLFCLALTVVPGDTGANRFGPPPDGIRGFILKRRLAALNRAFVRGKINAETFNARREELLRLRFCTPSSIL